MKEKEILIKAKWPEFDENRVFTEEENKIEVAMEAIRAIRNIKAEADAAPSKALDAFIYAEEEKMDVVKAGERYIRDLANIKNITFVTDKKDVPEEVMSAVISGAEIFIPLDELVDFNAEFERLTKEKKKLEGEVARVKGKLSNQGFISKAPEKVINEEREKQVKYEAQLAGVVERLELVAKKLNK